MKRMKDKFRIELTPPAFALIVANLVPLFGVLCLHWEVYPLVLLYWLENGVIGVFTILRTVFSTSPEPHKLLLKCLLTPFFCLHYGGFWAGHGLFVLLLFGHPMGSPLPRIAVATFLDAIRANALWFAVVSLAASHAYSFVWNFLVKGERNQAFIVELQEAPYRRVVVLHLFIILSGFLILQLHSPVFGMCVLVALKTVVDLRAHSQEHRRVESKRHKYLQMKYARAEMPVDPNSPDSLQQILPGYSRDLVAEKRHRQRASRLGCACLLCIPIGIAALVRHHTPIALCIFGVAMVCFVVSLVMYNSPLRVLCRQCRGRMEAMETGAQLQELPKMQRLAGTFGATQKWLVCHRCRSYFLCVLRTSD